MTDLKDVLFTCSTESDRRERHNQYTECSAPAWAAPPKRAVVIPAVSTYWLTAALSAEATVLSQYTTPAVIKREEDGPPAAPAMSLLKLKRIMWREALYKSEDRGSEKRMCNRDCCVTYLELLKETFTQKFSHSLNHIHCLGEGCDAVLLWSSRNVSCIIFFLGRCFIALFIELPKRDRKWGERGRMSCTRRASAQIRTLYRCRGDTTSVHGAHARPNRLTP